MKFLRISLPIILLLVCVCGVAVTVLTKKRALAAKSSSEAVDGKAARTSVDVPALPALSPAAAASAVSPKVAARMNTRSEGLQIVDHPDGRRSVNLGGRFAHTTAMVRAPDGRMVIQCFSNAEMLAAALAGAEKSQPVPAPQR